MRILRGSEELRPWNMSVVMATGPADLNECYGKANDQGSHDTQQHRWGSEMSLTSGHRHPAADAWCVCLSSHTVRLDPCLNSVTRDRVVAEQHLAGYFDIVDDLPV